MLSMPNLEEFARLCRPPRLRQHLDRDLQRGRVQPLLGVVDVRQGHYFLRPIRIPETMCRPHGQLVRPDRVLVSPLRHTQTPTTVGARRQQHSGRQTRLPSRREKCNRVSFRGVSGSVFRGSASATLGCVYIPTHANNRWFVTRRSAVVPTTVGGERQHLVSGSGWRSARLWLQAPVQHAQTLPCPSTSHSFLNTTNQL